MGQWAPVAFLWTLPVRTAESLHSRGGNGFTFYTFWKCLKTDIDFG